jgi:cation transport regulator ChaB
MSDNCSNQELKDITIQLEREITFIQGEIDRRFDSSVAISTIQHEGIRDYSDGQIGKVSERLDGIDKATELLGTTVNRVPTEIDREVAHLQSVLDERFKSVAIQFKERDTRQEREAKDNKVAVDAAFAAQKEAAAEQNKSNTLAISKSEVSTSETINKLAELFKGTTDGLYDKIDDLKDRITTADKRNGNFMATYTGKGIGVNQVWGYVVGLIGIITSIILSVAYVVKR